MLRRLTILKHTELLVTIKPGTHWPQAGEPGFIELLCPQMLVYVVVCVYMCPPPRPLITSGVMWCDIDPI